MSDAPRSDPRGGAGKLVPVVLTVAGFDPTGGAGVTADLATFAAFSCQGVSVVTAVTVQNSEGVSRVEAINPDLLADQLEAILSELNLSAVKIGMLATAANVDVVATLLERFRPPHVVLDPVLRSTSGFELLEPSGVEAMRTRLIPLAEVLTPNRAEAVELAQSDSEGVEIGEATARRLEALGAKAVVVTGGESDPPEDWLWQSGTLTRFAGKKVADGYTHGTGCAFSSAVAAGLALGQDLPVSVENAKRFVEERIRRGKPD